MATDVPRLTMPSVVVYDVVVNGEEVTIIVRVEAVAACREGADKMSSTRLVRCIA